MSKILNLIIFCSLVGGYYFYPEIKKFTSPYLEEYSPSKLKEKAIGKTTTKDADTYLKQEEKEKSQK